MTKDPRVYLVQILECAQKIERYLSAGEKAFFRDTMIQDAVIRNFEVIGEAAKRIPIAVRRENPSIPWKLMAGLRDVLIHHYEGVDLHQVWRIATEDLPPVRDAIAQILPPLDELEKEMSGDEEGLGEGPASHDGFHET